MKFKQLFSILFMVIVAMAAIVSAAYAAFDKPATIYGVKQISRPANALMIAGRVSCQPSGYKSNAYAVTEIEADAVRIMVYEKASDPKTKCRPSSFSLTVKPALVSGQTYSVYVNGRFRFSMTAK